MPKNTQLPGLTGSFRSARPISPPRRQVTEPKQCAAKAFLPWCLQAKYNLCIHPQNSKTVLVLTSLAFHPRSILEFSVLTDLPLDIAETVIEMSSLFLTIAKGAVSFIREPAKDYLEKNYVWTCSRLASAGSGTA